MSEPGLACCTPLTGTPMSAAQAEQVAPLLKALADPVRLRLVSLIAASAGGEACVCDLNDAFELTQATISHHLKVLHSAGVLDRDKRGVWVYYAVRPDALRLRGHPVRHRRADPGVNRTARQALAEFLGSAGLVTAVIGSGIAAQRLSPDDVGLQLLENALATGAALVALILAFGPVSGGHFNPVVTLADRFFGGVTNRQVAVYLPAQLARRGRRRCRGEPDVRACPRCRSPRPTARPAACGCRRPWPRSAWWC